MQKNRPLPQHILVLRLSAMGDVAMLPYAVDALKKAYPQVKITVASRPAFRPFFRDCDAEFFPADVKNEYRGIKGLLTLSKILRGKGIDAFADEHGVLRSTFLRALMRLHGIRTVRIDKGHCEKRKAVKHHGSGQYLKHTVIRYCDTLRRLGFDFPDPQPAAKKSRPCPIECGAEETKVGFAPFSAHRGKSCPEILRRQITERLSSRFDRVFIHGGGGEEADFAHEMESLYPNVTAVFGRVSGLGGEMDLISNLDCMVSMDSLAMHIASLTATPVVSIWGATHPKLGFLGYGCDTEGIVQTDAECRPCSTFGNKECRFGTYACLTAITAEDVADRTEKIIAKHKTR